MTEEEKAKLEKKRRETTLKNTFFNRYLMFRYSLALFFFANIYWLIIQFIKPSWYMTIPICLLFLLILASAEQFRMYGSQIVLLKWTSYTMNIQLIVQLLSVSLIILTDEMTIIFPIFASNQIAKLFVIVVLLVGASISLLNIRQIQKIMQNKDRAYKHYKQMEKAMS